MGKVGRFGSDAILLIVLLDGLLYPCLPRFILCKAFFHILRLPFREGFVCECLSVDDPAVPWLMTLIATRAPTLRDRW